MMGYTSRGLVSANCNASKSISGGEVSFLASDGHLPKTAHISVCACRVKEEREKKGRK